MTKNSDCNRAAIVFIGILAKSAVPIYRGGTHSARGALRTDARTGCYPAQRPEAKRLLHNLDRFAEIDLDMKHVRYVGQGFADEVFRVFALRHPGIVIRALNSGKAVDAMIRHARASARE